MDNLADKRENYIKGSLTLDTLASDPMIQFENWYHDAERAKIIEPNAMTLSTATPQGMPSSRMVLLKGFGNEGFVFYSNYTSRKAQELIQNPFAAINFWWKELERQVRVEGTVIKISEDRSASYFNSRPRGSQLSAWASPQSQEIREHYLESKRKEVEAQFEDVDTIPLPPHWGGYLIKPAVFEFWQGKESRFHDRYRYTHMDEANWRIVRLAP